MRELADESEPEPRAALEPEQEAALAEDMLEAEASADDLEQIEDRLEVVDAEEDDIEALARTEAAGNPDTETVSEAGFATLEVADDDIGRELDDIVRLRIEDELGAEAPAGVAGKDVDVPPRPAADEFVCRSCHLVKRRTQLADPARLWCQDCINDPQAGI